MTLDQLKYFLTAGRHEHIGRAAKILNMTPSTISHAIAALEDEFGQALFVKRGKNIFLTQAGKALMIQAESLLNEARKIEEDFKTDLSQLQGNYRLAATHFLSELCLTPSWMETVDQFPRVTAEMYSLRSAKVLEGVLGGEFDGGLCFSPQDNAKLCMEPIHSGQLLPAVKKGHPLLMLKGKKAVEGLREYKHIGAKSFRGIEVCEQHAALKSYNVDPDSSVLYDSYHVAIHALLQSDFWALIPDWIIAKCDDKISPISLPKDWDAPYEVCFIYDRRYHKSRVFSALMSSLKKYMSAY